MGAGGEFALFGARIHAADTGNHPRAGKFIKPCQFALHLQREFARRRDDQRQRRAGPFETLGFTEEIFCNRQPIGDGLAGSGLRRNQEIAAVGGRRQHRGLNLGQRIIIACRQGPGKRRTCGHGCHGVVDLGWFLTREH